MLFLSGLLPGGTDSTFYLLQIKTLIPFLRFFLCGLIFSSHLKKHHRYAQFTVISLLMMVLNFYAVVAVRYFFDIPIVHIISRTLNYTCILPYLLLCFDEAITTKMLCWSACIATQEIGEQLGFLLMLMMGGDDSVSVIGFPGFTPLFGYILYFTFRSVIYLLCYRITGRTDQIEYNRSMALNITIFSVFTMLILSLFGSVTREFRTESPTLYGISILFSLLYAITILIFRTGFLSYGKGQQELLAIGQMMREEQKRYQDTKESIDIINMRCHDLRHRMSDIQDKLNEEEFRILQDAVAIYDRNIKTGNEILDVILNSKQLACQEKQISISCMADGSVLSFMSLSHLSSLFGNAVDNAIEAVSKIPDYHKRVIDITVRQEGTCAVIHMSNYFSGEIPGENGFPYTTKEDPHRHGFGMKSMKYVADQYGGTVSVSIEQDVFSLDVTIPIPEKEVPYDGNANRNCGR